MTMHLKTPTKTRIIRAIPLLLSLGLTAYMMWEITASSLVPSLYIFIVTGVLALIAILTVFLWSRWFTTRRRRVTARIIAIIIMVALVAVSLLGIYVLKRGLSALNGLSNDGSAVTVNTGQSFNIFISGMDAYGELTNQSLSDVNIVATVNPATHQVLLTTVPRDSYLPIAGGGNGGMDKLTHAGIYGPEASMKTVARLLDIDMDAYVRINFTSFIESIDTIGGISLNNPRAFTIWGEHFPAGQLQLNGKRALLYSRERKSFAGGDVDRGKNQQRVIQAVIHKVTQIRSINGFEALLGMIGSSVDTNMSQATVRSLINRQLANPTSWTTESYTITGVGRPSGLPSYAMPERDLYMYVLDDNSINTARQKIESYR